MPLLTPVRVPATLLGIGGTIVGDTPWFPLQGKGLVLAVRGGGNAAGWIESTGQILRTDLDLSHSHGSSVGRR